MMRDLELIAQAQKEETERQIRYAWQKQDRDSERWGEKLWKGWNRRVYKKRQRRIKGKPLVQ